MRRREFMSLLGALVAARPSALRAQRSATPVIGFLDPASPERSGKDIAAFLRGLSEAGFVDGANVAIEYRWAGVQFDRLPALAAELARREVSVIVAAGSSPAVAAKAATATIPIVFYSGGDPVALGLVASRERPAGNATGVSQSSHALAAERLDLLRALAPSGAMIAVLVHQDNVNTQSDTRELQDAARVLGLEIRMFNARSERDIDAQLELLDRQKFDAMLVVAGAFFLGRRDRLVAIAARHGVPAIYARREYVEAGGLMSYGPIEPQPDAPRQAGIYTGRILKGEKPADLPVLQAASFELLVNRKAAKALGLGVPAALLARADAVID